MRYLFEREYFGSILGFERSWLLLCTAPSGATAAEGVAALSDGILHYYLGGTAEAHLGDSPFKNIVEAMIELAARLSVTLNLGWRAFGPGAGGLQARLCQRRAPLPPREVVCDRGLRAAQRGSRGFRLLSALPQGSLARPIACLERPPPPRSHRQGRLPALARCPGRSREPLPVRLRGPGGRERSRVGACLPVGSRGERWSP